MIDQETKKKVGIYGINFITPSVVNFLKNTPRISEVGANIPGLERIASSANPFGAVFFGALDIAGGLSDKIKNSRFTRFPQLVGAAFYGGSALMDVLAIANGEYQSFANLAFDASMAYQLGKDTAENYRGRDLLDDFTEW